jgi:hypothetical protein
MQILHRLGTFFILIGLVALVLYAGSVISKDVKTNYLLASIVTLLVGFLLQRNKQPSDSGRFSAIRRASANSRQRREEKMNQKPKK